MKTFFVLVGCIFSIASHARETRTLSCYMIDDGYTKTQRLLLPLREVSSREIEDCRKNQYCGANPADYLVSDSKPAFTAGRYQVTVAVLVDYSITSLRVADTAKKIGFSLYSSRKVPAGQDYQVFVEQREKSLSSQLVGCKIELQ